MVNIVRQPQTFYRRTASKNVVQWTIWLEEDKQIYTIKTSHGQKGGKIIEDAGVVIVSGKSGRTPDEQAILEFDSKVKKHRDQGYTFNTDGINVNLAPVPSWLKIMKSTALECLSFRCFTNPDYSSNIVSLTF